MSRFKAFTIASCLGLLAVTFLPTAKADQWNKRTIITVNEPLAIPGKVLQPGKYVMKLMESPGDRHIVQVFNEDESQIQTTILAIPNYKLEPADETQFSFWEMPAGQPRALKAWFYPGDNMGQEFAYPKDLAATIAKTNNENVPMAAGDENSEVSQMTPSGAEAALESESADSGAPAESPAPTMTAAAQPAPQPQPAAQPEPAPQPSAAVEPRTDMSDQPPAAEPAETVATTTGTELPATASPLPLMGLVGLVSLGGALAARAIRRRA